MNTAPTRDSGLLVRVRGVQESFKRVHDPDGPDPVTGKFTFEIDISATAKDVYVPLSVASGKKPTGFLYQIEGTIPGIVKTTDIECRGNGITQITLGTIAYCKVPAGLTATFRIRVEMRGKVGKSYGIAIYLIHYKYSPVDARYQKSPQDIRSRILKFS